MIGVLCSGGGIKETGNLFSMMDIEYSKPFVRRYRRWRDNLPTIINQIASKDIENTLRDEIDAAIICEQGLEFYLRWIETDIEKYDPVKVTISFDFGWQRAESRKSYNSESGHSFIVG